MAISFPNVVKATGNGVTSVTSGSVTTTTGSTFLIFCTGGSATPTSFGDSKSNTYTQIAALAKSGARYTAHRSENGTGGSGHTATVNFDTTEFPVLHFVEAAGAATASYDSPTLNTDQSADLDSITTSSTLAQADSAVFSFYSSNAAGTLTYNIASGGWTVSSETDGNTYWSGAIAYKTVSSTSAVTVTWDDAGGSNLLGIFALKAAAGGSTITPADGVATTSTMTGSSTAAATIDDAAGVATTSTMTGSSAAAASFTAAAGVATTSTMAGEAIAVAAFVSASGQATTDTMVGASTAAATITSAAGQATTDTLAGSSVAAATFDDAAGIATTATMTATATAVAAFIAAQGVATTSTLFSDQGTAAIVPAAGLATTSTMTGASTAVASFLPAAGVATTATMVGSDASAPGGSGALFRPTFRPRRR